MADTTLKRYPVRAAVWGFFLGLGVFIYLTFVWPIIALDSWTAVVTKAAIVVLVVMALSVLWGLFGPAKKPKGYQATAPPPAADLPPPAPEMASAAPVTTTAPAAPPTIEPAPPPEAPRAVSEETEAVGEALAAPELCPDCGTEIRAGAKVCHACGFRLAGPGDEEQSEA